MTDKFIPITDLRRVSVAATVPSAPEVHAGSVTDRLRRPLRDLRISVMDRCNFRCVYCMPKDVFDQDYVFLPKSALLSFEEITRLAKVFVAHGVEKIRLTGGEPLLRKNIEILVEMLSALRTADGRELDLTLTTNGSLLAQKAQALKDAGLKRVTVSLDSLDDATFKGMNGVQFPVADVLRGIDAAHQAGIGSIKINMVVKNGVNDHDVVPMARHFKGTPHILRFIEYMDVGTSNGWKMDETLPSAEIVRRISADTAVEEIAPNYSGETSERWRYRDGGGEFGVISSVTQPFCHSCTRVRLSTEGQLYTCLFASGGHDLRALLRGGNSAADISAAIAHIWRARDDRYSELRGALMQDVQPALKKVEMSYIGG